MKKRMPNFVYPEAHLTTRIVAAWWLGGCLMLSWPVQAEIYKWRDAKGVMNYSDMPPPNQQHSVEKIKSQTLDANAPLTRADAYKSADTPPSKPRVDEKVTPSDSNPNAQNEQLAATKAMEERLKAKNCLAARSNYRNYAIGGRMQQVNENGEKEFLSEAQIQEGLNQAQREIDENCPLE